MTTAPLDPEERPGLLPALLDGLLDPLLCIDARGTVLLASASVEAIFGYRPEELIGQNVKLLMPEPHRSQHDEYLARYAATGETAILGRTRPFTVLRRDGEPIDVELSVSRVDPPDGGEPLFLGSFRDVTDRNRSRQAEVSVLKALAAIGESAAVLAHEIKNPVTSINLALRAVADKLGAEEQAVLEELAGSLRRLERQMRQTLAFARPLDLAPMACDMGELLATAARSLSPVVTASDAELEIDVAEGTPQVLADPGRLDEVLTNLVMNALEASETGRRRVRLSAAANDRGQVVLRVDDDGPGVPHSVIRNLFKPFFTSKPRGTGLGLPICRRIAEEHGGSLDLVDGQLGGACFALRLPVAGPAPDPTP